MSSIPSFEREGCPRCAEFPGPVKTEKGNLVARCVDCGEQMTHPMPPSGYQSCRVDHYHFQAVSGIHGRSVVQPQLCEKCYLIDFTKKYGPDVEPPDLRKHLVY